MTAPTPQPESGETPETDAELESIVHKLRTAPGFQRDNGPFNDMVACARSLERRLRALEGKKL